MESVFILKIFKNFKNCATLFWRLTSQSSQSHAPAASLYRRFSWLTSGLRSQLWKRLRNFFKNLGFLDVSRLSLVTCAWVEAPVMRCTQHVSRLPSRLPRRWTFQSRKTLRQIFPIFVSRVLATWSGDLFVTYFSHENCVFCDLRIVKKKKKVFPRSFWLFIVLSVHLSHKLTVFLSKIHHFRHRLFFKLQEKVWVFYFSQSISCL